MKLDTVQEKAINQDDTLQAATEWANLSLGQKFLRNVLTLGEAERKAEDAFRSLKETPKEIQVALTHIILSNYSIVSGRQILGISFASGVEISIELAQNKLLLTEINHETFGCNIYGTLNGQELTAKQTKEAFSLFNKIRKNKVENIIRDPNAEITRDMITGIPFAGGERVTVKAGSHLLKLQIVRHESAGWFFDGSLDQKSLTSNQVRKAWNLLNKIDKSCPQPNAGVIAFEVIDPKSIDFTDAAVLLNRTKRVVLPIPTLPNGGEELRFPKGHEKAGQAIYSNEDGTVQKGIVFANKTDSGWQGVQGNGKEAIIINDLTSEQAQKLCQYIRQLCPDITKLTAEQVNIILDYTRKELGIVDMFDKDLLSISKEMRFVDNSLEPPSLSDPKTFFGYMEVSKNDEHRAVRVDGAFSIQGPINQKYINGAVIVTNGRRVWGLDSTVCKNGWVLKRQNGEEIAISDIRSDIPEYKS